MRAHRFNICTLILRGPLAETACVLYFRRSGVVVIREGPGLTSPLLVSLDSPKTSRNFCRLLSITEETWSAASNPGPRPAVGWWVSEALLREAVTLTRPALLPVPELLLPPGRAGNRHRQLCAILHSACLPLRSENSVGGTLKPALHINKLRQSVPLSLVGRLLCMLRGA